MGWSRATRHGCTISNSSPPSPSGRTRFGNERASPVQRRCINRNLLIKWCSLLSSIPRASITSTSAHWRHTLLENTTRKLFLVSFLSFFLFEGPLNAPLHVSWPLIEVEKRVCALSSGLELLSMSAFTEFWYTVWHILNWKRSPLAGTTLVYSNWAHLLFGDVGFPERWVFPRWLPPPPPSNPSPFLFRGFPAHIVWELILFICKMGQFHHKSIFIDHKFDQGQD